jgi:hypothetical protein
VHDVVFIREHANKPRPEIELHDSAGRWRPAPTRARQHSSVRSSGAKRSRCCARPRLRGSGFAEAATAAGYSWTRAGVNDAAGVT